MRPELFRFFDVGFPSYFMLLVSGFVVAIGLGVLWARRTGVNPDVVVDLGLTMLLAGIAGARILHVLADGYFWDYVHRCTDPAKVDWAISRQQCVSNDFEWDVARQLCHPKVADCWAWAKFWGGGLTYYGGFIGATAAAVILLRRDRFPFWKAADMAGFAIPIGLTFGRMGCLLAGCCFGSMTDLPWGMSFPAHSPASEEQAKAHLLETAAAASHPVHPTQVYESAACLVIAGICLFGVEPRKRYDGQVFVTFLGLYAAARCLLEILRRDDRGGFWGLSTSQLIGLALVAAAVGLHTLLSRRARALALARVS